MLYGVRWDGCYYVYFCMGDGEGVIFMIDYDDGCGVVGFLGCHTCPVNECHGSFEV